MNIYLNIYYDIYIYHQMDNIAISRIDKLRGIGLDETLTVEQLSDNILDEIYNKFITKKQNAKMTIILKKN